MSSTNQDDVDAIIGVAAISVLAAGVAIIGAYEHESSIPREPYVNKDQEREFYMNSILNGSDVHCVGQIRMINHGKKGEKQFRWSKLMEYLMLEILADEVNQGNKSTNQFKASSFNRVLNAINEQLEIDCSSKHMKNHLKTIRNTWSTIQTLPNKSGLGWDDNLKMITASPEVYAVHIQAHPNHDKFINKKIKIFDEISLVCGNDRARGDCAKSFEDIDFDSFSEKDNNNDLEGPSIEKDVQATEAS
ncbi:hypothetical protein FXO38_17379 [Capsicum annuum]|nr:hypothetical protein FXO37_23947 [Capsicum annuum]KAF3649974.1 hypothetical protein FXO38_17379 [Capsicum annuum]